MLSFILIKFDLVLPSLVSCWSRYA